MKISTIVVMLIVVLSLAAGTCPAGQSQAGLNCRKRFDSMDANNDGKVTLQEFEAGAINRAKAKKVFRSRDTLGRGYLTKDQVCGGVNR